MLEVRVTDKNRFAVRKESPRGLFVYGTGIVIDSEKSNLEIHTDLDSAFKKVIDSNRKESPLFDAAIDMNEQEIDYMIEDLKEAIDDLKENIEIYKNAKHCISKTPRS